MRQLPRLWMAGLFLVAFGCAQRNPRRDCVPASLTKAGPYIDLNARPDGCKAMDRPTFEALTKPGVCNQLPGKRTVLALSGGGKFGAYSVGVLNGWRATGTMPRFDILTGVSTGAIIGTYAFLGGEYETRVAKLYTSMDSADVFRSRRNIALLWADAAATSKPLEKLLAENIDAQMVAAVGAAHAEGRRFYVATTNLDTMKLVIWDMGAIASSGRPDAVELYRRIILASSAVPGFLPPVKIDVTVNGRRYSEMHCDGGATSQVFVRAPLLNIDESAIKEGKRPLTGTDVHVIIAGKIFADPECTKPNIKGVATSALNSLVYADARENIDRIFGLCQATGMKFHVAALPADVPVKNDSLDFRPEEMKRLYVVGYNQAITGTAWATSPPASEWNEGSIPRSGTDFLAPVEVIEARK